MMPGGSSSGTAASTAAGMAYAGMGSCTGGSIRWPAQCCGIVGLKSNLWARQSSGCVSALVEPRPHRPARPNRDRRGPHAGKAAPSYDPLDPASANVPVPDFTQKLGQDITGMRIGLLRSIYEDNCDPKLLGPYNEAVKQFERLGAEIVDVPSITLSQLQAIEWPGLFADCAAIHVGQCTQPRRAV